MIRLLYVLIIIFSSSRLSAQSIEIYENDGVDIIGGEISGTTIEITADDPDYVIAQFFAKNVSDASINMRFERVKLVDAEGSEDFCRFGPLFDGALYAPEFVTSQNPFITPESWDIDTNELVDFASYYKVETSVGCSYYRLYVIDDTDARLDSVDVQFCSTLSLNQTDLEEVFIYPNPATDFIQLNYPTELNQNATVQLTDLTGKIVLSTSLKTSLDVSSYANGVYVLSIFDQDSLEAVFKERIVIQ